MPPPILVFGPLAKHAVLRASMEAGTTATAGLSVYLACRLVYSQLPDWIRNDVALQFENEDELATISSITEKLQGLMVLASQKLLKPQEDNDEYDPWPATATVWRVLQLLRRPPPQAETRRMRYQASGVVVTEILDEVARLQQSLDWAIAAYESDTTTLQAMLSDDTMQILQHNTLSKRPGHVGHFVAVNDNKQLIIGVRGTSSLEDFLTDCCGRPVLVGELVSTAIEVRASQDHEISSTHCGIEVMSGLEQINWEDHVMAAHEGVLLSAQRLAATIMPLIHEHADHQILLCGHSLGAGVASLLGILLHDQYPNLDLRVDAFASPPVCDYQSSISAASYITTVVNNSDGIPRGSLANVVILLEALKTLYPTTPQPSEWLQLLKSQGDGGVVLKDSEIETALSVAQSNVSLHDCDHLYVPGRVLLLHEQRDGSGKWQCVETNGVSKALRSFEWEGNSIVADHVTAAYTRALQALRGQVQPLKY